MLAYGVEHGADDEGVAVPAGVEDGADDEGVAEPEAAEEAAARTVYGPRWITSAWRVLGEQNGSRGASVQYETDKSD